MFIHHRQHINILCVGETVSIAWLIWRMYWIKRHPINEHTTKYILRPFIVWYCGIEQWIWQDFTQNWPQESGLLMKQSVTAIFLKTQ